MKPKKDEPVVGRTNGSFNVAKLYDVLEKSELKNDIAHNEIKADMQRNRVEILDKVADVRERMIKIEAQPAHENFQKTFCPNTSAIRELEETGTKALKEYEDEHRMEHKELNSVLKTISDKLEDVNLKLNTIDGRITTIESSSGLSRWIIGGVAGLAVALIILLVEHLLGGG